MSKIFVSSDYHFNHDREFIWKARGFNSVDEMNEAIIERHNSVVAPEDDIYILGDICLGGGVPGITAKNQALIERLNGRIHIILGNHDTPARQEMYMMCKNVVDVKYADMIRYNGYHFYLSHFPTITSNLEKETLKQCTICLFGHTHQNNNFFMDMPFMYHVGVDSHNCTPVLLDDAIEDMKAKVKECLDTIQPFIVSFPQKHLGCEKCIYEYKCYDAKFNRRCNNYKKDPPDGGYYG